MDGMIGGAILENVIRCASRLSVGEATQDPHTVWPLWKIRAPEKLYWGIDSSRGSSKIRIESHNQKQERREEGKYIAMNTSDLTCGGAAVRNSAVRASVFMPAGCGG